MTTPAVKVLIVERAGVELDNQEEFNLTAETIPFTAPGFASDNIKDAVVEAATLDVHSCQYDIEVSDVVLVSAKKQMRVFYQETVSGQLTIDGWLIVD